MNVRSIMLKRSKIHTWVIPSALMLLGLAGQGVLTYLGDPRPFIFLYPAIAIGCFFGNRWSTLLAVFVGSLGARLWFFEDGSGTQLYFRLSVFFFSGVVISLLSDLAIRLLEEEIHVLEEKNAGKRIDDVIESMSDAFFAIDKNWKITRVNAKHVEITKVRREAQLGRDLRELFFADPTYKTSKYWKAYHQAMIERTPVHFEDYYEPLKLWTDVRVFPQNDGGIAAFFSDISERKRQEIDLAVKGQKLDALVRESPSAIALMVGPDLIFEIANKKWDELVSPRAYVGRSYAEVYPELVGSLAHQSMLEIYKTGVPFVASEMKLKVISQAGILEDQYYDYTNIRIMDSEGKPYGIYCNALNVTERVRSRQRLIESAEMLVNEREKLEAIFYGTDSPMVLFRGADLVFEMANAKYMEMIANRDVIGKPLLEGLPEIANSEFPDVIERVYQTGKPFRFLEGHTPILNPTTGLNEDRYFDSTFARIRGESGQPNLVIGHAMDVTEKVMSRKALEQAKRDAEVARAEAEAANDLKSAFLANMSHEIRTPLGAMIGFADLLRDPGISKTDHSNYLDVLSRNAEQLSFIINDILDLSKVEAGHLMLEYLPTRPEQIMADVISLLRVKAKEKDLSLEYLPEASTPDIVISDPGRIRQVLINLISNSLKFTQFGKVQVISHSKLRENGATEVIFDIIDTGIGLPMSKAEQIFEMFVQADGSVTRKYGGTGLGLSLSRKLARSLGGDIVVLNTAPNQGSTFRFSFLDRPENRNLSFEDVSATEEHRFDPTSTDEKVLKNVKVLVVDDSPDNQSLLWHYLTKAGAVVETADNGVEGYKRAMTNDYDIILMDIQMPVMDGYTATHKLREIGFEKPIIALTAHAMSEVRRKCLNVGCNDHLSKPINQRQLIGTVAKYTHEAPV